MVVVGAGCGDVCEGWLPERDGFGLRAGEGGDEDLPGACFTEGRGAGAGGGATGVDIVDEQDIAAGDEGGLGHGEGAAEVLAALAGVEAELAFGLPGAGEEVMGGTQTKGGMGAAEGVEGVGGEELGLVEAALAGLAAEEGDGGDEGLGGGIEEWGEIGNGVGEEMAERPGGQAKGVEFQKANEAAQLALIDAEGDGAGEGGRNAAARGTERAGGVAAGEEALAFKAEGFAADDAERRGGVGFGLGAKRAEAELANGEGRGAEKRGGAEPAVGGEEGGEEIVKGAAGCAAKAERGVGRGRGVVLLRALGSALCVCSSQSAGRSLCEPPERLVIQAFAEDSPHSHDAPGPLTASLPGV